MELIEEANSDEKDFYENVDLLCRLCCKPSRIPLIPIYFDETDDELPLKIKSYLPINISMDDELPQKICFKCVNNVFVWHDFFQNCINADSKLRHMLSQRRSLNCAVKETNIKTESLESEELQDSELEGEICVHVKDEAENISSEEEIDCGFKDSNSVQLNKEDAKNRTDAHQNTNAQTIQIPIHSDEKVHQLCQQNLDFQNKASRKKLSREERLEKKREAERMRYQRIKNDPERYAQQKEKEKKKYEKKKEKGIIKTVSQLTPREQRNARKLWRENIKKYRRRLALQDVNNAPIIPPSSNDKALQLLQNESHDKRAETARKKASRAKRSGYLLDKKKMLDASSSGETAVNNIEKEINLQSQQQNSIDN